MKLSKKEIEDLKPIVERMKELLVEAKELFGNDIASKSI